MVSMKPASRHPLVLSYYSELREKCSDLDDEPRRALLGEAVQQLNAATRGVRDDEMESVLAAFADPADVVAASGRLQAIEEAQGVGTGAVPLYLAIVGLAFVFIPWIGAAIGALAVVAGLVTLVRRRAAGLSIGVPLGAIGVGVLAVVLPIVLLIVLNNIQDDQSTPTPKVVELR